MRSSRLRSTLRTTVTAAASLLLAAGLLAAGTPTAGAQAPAASGPTGGVPVATAQYDLGDTAFTDPQSGTVSELRAVVHYPRHLGGRLPLIVMSHGSWWACDSEDADTWP